MLSRRRLRMRPGYFAMPLHPPGADPARTMDDDLVQLATLDRLGCEEAWIGEHVTAQWETAHRAAGPDGARPLLHRPASAPQALPETAPADRRGRRIGELGDARARGRARLHPDVDQLRAAADLEDALGGWGGGGGTPPVLAPGGTPRGAWGGAMRLLGERGPARVA